MRHSCTAAATLVPTPRANATQIYWVAASAVAHLPSPCAAAKYPRKIYARCLTAGKKGIGHNNPESSCGSGAGFAQSYHCVWTSSAGRRLSRGNRLPAKIRGSHSSRSGPLRNARALLDPWTNCALRKLYHPTRSPAGSYRCGRSKSETSRPRAWTSARGWSRRSGESPMIREVFPGPLAVA